MVPGSRFRMALEQSILAQGSAKRFKIAYYFRLTMPTPVSVGDVVARKYRVDRVLGEGGMGVVVAATDTQLDRRVAIKFLLPDMLSSPDVVARFSREARAAAKIHSEHVARVIEVGELETGAPFMVMEYLEGRDLAERIRVGPPLSASEAARYVLQACEALAEAHAAGIVHRDLKPANLFLAQQPDRSVSVKVLDFGISKAPVGSGGITSTQAVMGSPHYMSPEQLVSAKHVDHRSDVWSLGIVLYEAVAGSPPFTGETMPEIVAKILQAPLPSLRALRPDAPVELEHAIARCTTKDPAARFRDVAELARTLVGFAPDAARSAERAARILGQPSMPPREASPTTRDAVASSPTPAKAETSPDVRSHEAWGNTRAAGVPRRNMAPYAIAGVVGAGAMVVGLALIGGRAASPAAGPMAAPPPRIEPPSPPAAIATQAEVLAPLPTASATESSAPSVSASAPKPAVAKPAAAPRKATPTATAVSAPPPPPTPAPGPADPLHMGIK
jgi:serine/threonine-protein kinase